MEAQTTAQTPSDPSSATYTRWVIFEQELKIEAESSCCSMSGDASKTSVAALTSSGHPIQISLRLAEPPAISCVCLQISDGLEAREPMVLAAHSDSVLIMVQHGHTKDHFVYNAGNADADPPRPPSLSLLPPFNLWYRGTGLVRRGEDELVVAYLNMVSSATSEPDTVELTRAADLSLFRAGVWSVRRVELRFRDDSEVPELASFSDSVVPVGDGLLCWVDLWRLGMVLCDVFEETPKLQYLPLPRENVFGNKPNWNVCATAGGDALKFVNIFPRCCCGGAGASSCERSSHAYTIQTWTMRISNDDDMEWVKDSIVDASELWPLDSYKGLRCFPLDHPIVSMDDPNLICFWLHEPSFNNGYGDDYEDWSVDLLMVNTRSKTIHSVSHHEDESLLGRDPHLIPSNVSYFFNSYRSSCGGSLIGPRKKSNERPPPDIIDEQQIRVKRPHVSFAEPSVQASEICEAFKEIPSYGLDQDELKVYRILSSDNCRRVRSLLGLPKNLRKDYWLLMEIKASEDY